jgi:hypothetical protein
MSTVKKSASWLVHIVALCGLVWASGCGDGQPEKPFDARDYQGKVDTTLPPHSQQRQEALRRLLNALQEGVGDKAALGIFAPEIDYREKFSEFFAGHKRLVRWEFSGKPDRDNVAVTLFFDDLDSGPVDPDKLVSVDRVYVVSSAGRRFAVSRK